MKSSNPIFRDSVTENVYAINDKPMTVSGTMNKLLLLSVIMLISAGAVYYQFSLGHYDYVQIIWLVGMIVGIILSLIIAFKPTTAKMLSPVYAFCEGAFISAVSCFFEKAYEGIVTQAISVTFIVVFAMALLYKTGLIKATDKFRSIIVTATFAIMIFYLISLALSFFHVNIPYFTSTSGLAIAINIGIAIVAALNLILDFDFIERGTQSQLPSYFEWYGAFGLLVTIIWLYLEILKVLSRLRSR